MASIQLFRDQLINSIIDSSKLDDNAIIEAKIAANAVAFAKIKSSDIETNLSSSASASKIASAAAIKTYVDAQVPDTFQGGDGIVIDASTSPDTIKADLAASNPGLFFDSAKLSVQVKSESGGTISKDANGLFIGDGAIGNAKLAGSIANGKLANSTISGKALGTNLDTLQAGNGLALGAPYNGSAAQTLDIQLDGSTLSKGGSGLKVGDGAIGMAQISFQSRQDVFVPNGSTLAFNLTVSPDAQLRNMVMVFRNGVLQKLVASSPSGTDEYTVTESGGTTTITFGANIPSGNALEVRYLA
jgi:hypothetical protein